MLAELVRGGTRADLGGTVAGARFPGAASRCPPTACYTPRMKFVVSHPVVLAGALALTGASFAFGCSSSDEGGDAAAQDALGAAGGSDDESEPESSASGTAAATTDPLPESSSGSTATIGDGPTMPSTSGPSLGPLPRAPGSVVRVDHGYPLIDPVDGVCQIGRAHV